MTPGAACRRAGRDKPWGRQWLRLSSRLGLAAVCALAAACASRSPPGASSSSALPDIELPLRWAGADAAGGGARGVDADSLVAWWQRFDDPLMTDLINQALAANAGVNAAQASLRQAQALRDVATAGLAPTLGAGASAQRGMAGGNSTGSRLQAGLDGQWAPDIFGARRSGVEAADAVAAASSATLGDTQVQVAAEVALNVIALRSTQARWAIASANLANQQETLQITDWRQQAGLVTALEFEQARAAAAQTQSLLPALQTSLQLVSVTERTREIGLRLAVGALESEVLLQFLIETVVLSAMGGVVGVAIATAASYGGAQLMSVPYVFDPTINAVALVFSAAIGMVFGYFPARRAAQMDPIEALRHE